MIVFHPNILAAVCFNKIVLYDRVAKKYREHTENNEILFAETTQFKKNVVYPLAVYDQIKYSILLIALKNHKIKVYKFSKEIKDLELICTINDIHNWSNSIPDTMIMIDESFFILTNKLISHNSKLVRFAIATNNNAKVIEVNAKDEYFIVEDIYPSSDENSKLGLIGLTSN